MTKHFASFFFRREEINIPTWQDVFVFKVSTFQILYVPDRCHKPAQRCDRRRAERNYTRCKYQHK